MKFKRLIASPLTDELKQYIFEKVATHLLTQNKWSYNYDEGYCMYRSEDGYKCAVGCLIDDDEYDPIIEKVVVDVLPSTFCSVIHQDTATFLRALQMIHDTIPLVYWKEKLIVFYQHKIDAVGPLPEFLDRFTFDETSNKYIKSEGEPTND